ncbi:MAG: class I SAM-dependent methyltransferase [Desulfopila sp.]
MKDRGYLLLDSGEGEKLESFGNVILSRPAAQAVWKKQLPPEIWAGATASFDREKGNSWSNRQSLPKQWQVEVSGMTFKLSSTDFGHLGIFPEQAANWQWLRNILRGTRHRFSRPISVLNLFAYSGGSTMATALEGATVCHLDAAKGMVDWARENSALNGLTGAPIRWLVDDAVKFLQRQRRRGDRYDGIILDPPSFGRGKRGEIFKIERDILTTLELCRSLLNDTPLFVLFSCHTNGFTPTVMENLLSQLLADRGGTIESGEMFLLGEGSTYSLPNGSWARWLATP